MTDNNVITEVERRSVEWVQKQQAKGRERYGQGLEENTVPNVSNLCEELADALQYATAHQIRLNNIVNDVIMMIGIGNLRGAVDLLQELRNE